MLTIEAPAFHSLDEALQRLGEFIGQVPEWRELTAFLPAELRGAVFRRSALASTFAATLELARARPHRIAPGPCLRAHLPAQPGGAPRRRAVNERQFRLRWLEALLFAARQPLAEEELAQRLGEGADVAALLRELSRALRRARRQPGALGWRLDLSHGARPRGASRQRTGRRAQIVARRRRDVGNRRLSSAGDPRRDRGDPRRGAGARHARSADGGGVGAPNGAARERRAGR